MTTKTSPLADLPKTLTDMVSDVAMQLPPLTRPQDADFLRGAFMLAATVFWENYRSLLPEAVDQEYIDAVERGDTEAVILWYQTYANFAEDAEADRRGRNILEDIEAKLPSVLQGLYQDFGS